MFGSSTKRTLLLLHRVETGITVLFAVFPAHAILLPEQWWRSGAFSADCQCSARCTLSLSRSNVKLTGENICGDKLPIQPCLFEGQLGYLPMAMSTVWFCLCPENEVIEKTKHNRYKDVSHSFLDLKREHEHGRHKRSTGETRTTTTTV